MDWLTRQERFVVWIVAGLLITGWAVKLYRGAPPVNVPARVSRQP